MRAMLDDGLVQIQDADPDSRPHSDEPRQALSTQTVLSAGRRPDGSGTGQPEARGKRLRRIVGLLARVAKARGSYYDPLFERPDLIEDDYYRLRR